MSFRTDVTVDKRSVNKFLRNIEKEIKRDNKAAGRAVQRSLPTARKETRKLLRQDGYAKLKQKDVREKIGRSGFDIYFSKKRLEITRFSPKAVRVPKRFKLYGESPPILREFISFKVTMFRKTYVTGAIPGKLPKRQPITSGGDSSRRRRQALPKKIPYGFMRKGKDRYKTFSYKGASLADHMEKTRAGKRIVRIIQEKFAQEFIKAKQSKFRKL